MHVASNLYMSYYVNVPKLAAYLAYTTVAITGVGKMRVTKYGNKFFFSELKAGRSSSGSATS